MFFWKRVEIYCGFSLKEFAELRDALAAKGIQYDYRIINNNDNRKTGSIGINNNYNAMYYLYVHHKDFYNAMHITSNRHVS